MIQTIKKIALEAVQAESPLRLVEATVVSPPPDIQIRLKGNPKLLIPSDIISIAEHLTKHKRQIRVNGGTVQEYEFVDELKMNDRVMVAIIQGGQSFFIIDRIVG
ncbi:DUF2577 domain-containing protein [Parageobacillus thermoglucosidasius]|uniref:DUF2577 domain-containing protein n=1 Tax=Anoxybacillaceae TaxID=3120669 RepID=UPI00025B81AF|nr:DUF2577 domain-containing protein [Parageobacillus thermoglucosidasius]EID42851.1 phage-like element PBSX protein xkdR [Parageobacillus thermoglucosidasius TNO-09.020]KYD17849.1 hypothetical protein B4168_2410 [Anoxybacillus flavithermus]OAO85370.1 putative phage related protein [Parageobacillus thermoglucosidasius]